MDALSDGLPKTLPVQERRLNKALTDPLPRQMRRRSWGPAIDWYLQPYHGEPKQGMTNFHAYASACIVKCGRRYTVALTRVLHHESLVVVLRRLLATTREIGLKLKRVLPDRAFFNVPVIEFLRAESLPFVTPAVILGRARRKGRKTTGLRRIKHQPAGWHPHTMKSGKRQVNVSICVSYRSHRASKDRRRRQERPRR